MSDRTGYSAIRISDQNEIEAGMGGLDVGEGKCRIREVGNGVAILKPLITQRRGAIGHHRESSQTACWP